ncbi:CdaR family transcriptional regulator [Priestia koreensis]|uniref:Transcriptional regulator n=1 Tax=Priestia koreensis TaxID=284581 RepID=A0A0M0KEW3_9BACI|nr:sugar diacid recognition domain-containing protein [Priestia koreensis]KOO37385.1 hypothetical protein AMD01_23250 [Priestia koreensis]MCM3006505.1 helix-turn-helix domain-containing protein [Priestia koreensis]
MLSKEIAEAIVNETSLRLNRNINIMDEQGIIIASGNSSRIDSIHEGALHVVKSGQTLIISSREKGQWKGSEPGINLPIVFQKRIVGVIGITGEPRDVEELGGLVKMTTELMIEQRFIASQFEWKQRTKEMVIEELLKLSPSYSTIERGLNLLQLVLLPPFSVHIVQMTNRSLTNQQLIHRIETILEDSNVLIGFINVNRIFIASSGWSNEKTALKQKKLYRELTKIGLTFRFAFSTPFESMRQFHQAFTDCELSLEISDDTQDFISFAKLEAKSLLYKMEPLWLERFLERTMNDIVLKYEKTLDEFFKQNLNIQQTAESLFIHRNTLIYRLDKIKRETGYDPKDFSDALTLQLALWGHKRQKSWRLQ